MPKRPSRRNTPNYRGNDRHPDGPIHLPKELVRGIPKDSLSHRARKPVDYMARAQCVATSRNKLKRYWLKHLSELGIKPLPDANDPKYSYGDILELVRTYNIDPDVKRLPPEIRADCRCGNLAIAGGMVCVKHGGSSKQVIQAARERLHLMISPAMDRHVKIITKGKHEPAVVAAIKEVYEIVGMKKPDAQGSVPGFSDEMISKMAEKFSEEKLEMFIGMLREIQSMTPEEEESQIPVKIVNVSPSKMAELMKKPSKKAGSHSAA